MALSTAVYAPAATTLHARQEYNTLFRVAPAMRQFEHLLCARVLEHLCVCKVVLLPFILLAARALLFTVH